MTTTQPLNLDRLVKVLALAESTQDGEALAALRLAQQMLAVHNLTMSDLGALLSNPSGKSHVQISRSLVKAYEARISALEKENTLLRREVINAADTLEKWKSLLTSSQRDSVRHQASAEKWRELARKTADHLWELGQQLQAIDDTSSSSDSETNGAHKVVRLQPKTR
ncbi:MAG: DUF2786 domain-containing protein [Bdellovibrionales bacterium]